MIEPVRRDANVRPALGAKMARPKSDHAESEPYRLASSPNHLIHRAEQLAAERFAQLAHEDLTLRQFAVLVAIAEKPGMSQMDLVRATGIDRSTLADMMSRLERRGWVDRIASEADGRAHAVHLSAEGQSILQSSTQHARAADAAILDLLPKTKARSFLNILAKLSKLADEAAAKAERAAKRQAKREKKKDRKPKRNGKTRR
jgi:MarR family transcriptional regulator, temperature-dependent positive regulator of motility